MSVATARAAIVEALKAIPDLEVYGWPQQNANLPMAHVLLDTLDPDFVIDDDTQRMRFLVRLMVGTADLEEATAALDPFLAPAGVSVRGIVNDDPTLGGLVDSCRVVEVQSDRIFQVGGLSLVGAEFTLDVVG